MDHRREYTSYTDFEYIYLQILGFKAIQENIDLLKDLNNSKSFRENPGTQLLESIAGMTMHGERDGYEISSKREEGETVSNVLSYLLLLLFSLSPKVFSNSM